MTDWFADTAYFLALLSPDDDAHQAAVARTRSAPGSMVTTTAVLNELGNHLSAPQNRHLFLETIERLRANGSTIVHLDASLFEEGLRLYAGRGDKNWSLTDCVSFVVMSEKKPSHALTTDHHFRQAGFTILL